MKDESGLTAMEAEVEEATMAEDYDRAERLQGDIDAMQSRLGGSKQQLAATQDRLKQGDL